MLNYFDLLHRFGNRTPSQRLTQLANVGLVSLMGKSLEISHLIEYPKCGGSWIKNMIQMYIGGEPHYADKLVRRRSIVHLHRLYDRRYLKPIVVFRDPRDVYVSYYFYERALQRQGVKLAISKSITMNPSGASRSEFADYLEIKLTENTDPYFGYGEFVNSWKDKLDVCYVKYENFLDMPLKELEKAITFLGYDFDERIAIETIEFNSFKNVTQRKFGKSRSPGQEDPGSFQRKGVSGDWINHFSEKSCLLLDQYLGDVLLSLGYEAGKDWVGDFAAKRNADQPNHSI